MVRVWVRVSVRLPFFDGYVLMAKGSQQWQQRWSWLGGRTDEPKLLVYFLLTWSCWVQLSWLGVEYRAGPWHAKPMELCCGVIALPGMMAGMPWRSITDSNCTPVLAVAYHGWLVCGISEWVWVGVGGGMMTTMDDGMVTAYPYQWWYDVWCGVKLLLVLFLLAISLVMFACHTRRSWYLIAILMPNIKL